MILIKFLSTSQMFSLPGSLATRVSLQNIWTPVHRIIYMLNLWESPKSAGCDAGYELFLAVSLRRFYFTALPVVCARVKLEWVKRKKKKDAAEPRAQGRGVTRACTVLSRGLSRCLASRRRPEARHLPRGRRDGVRTLIGNPRPFLPPVLGKKKRATPSALCPLPSAGFLLTPPLKQIKAPSPSRAHLRSSR